MSTETESPRETSDGPGYGAAQNVQATAEESASQVQGKEQDVTAQGREKAQDAVSQIQDQAQAAVQQAQLTLGQTQQKLREQAEQRSSILGQQISAQASDLRVVSEALREQDQDSPARLADRAAGYAEQAGSYLENTDIDTIVTDAESYGRQHPATVAAGALAFGFAASRFLKASSARRYASQGHTGSTPSAAGSAGHSGPADTDPVVLVNSTEVPGTHPIEPVPEGKPEVAPPTMNEGI
jgi:hypothetical protein